MDYYYEGFPNDGITDAMTITFPPAPVDRQVSFYLNHAGTDHEEPCRPEAVWAAIGSGTPPSTIINNGPTPAKGITAASG